MTKGTETAPNRIKNTKRGTRVARRGDETGEVKRPEIPQGNQGTSTVDRHHVSTPKKKRNVAKVGGRKRRKG